MSKKIKLVTTLDSGGILDSTILINKKLRNKGYSSSIIKVDKFEKNIIKNISDGDHVILQMSGYGFHKKGIPLWLINEIKMIKKKSTSLGIHFHELNIKSKLWNPRVILMLLQKYINIQLLKYCDYWVTSTKQYAKWLKKYSYKKKNYICSVHSNINHKLNKVKKNKRIVILFGTSASRIEIYKKYFDIIKNWIIKNDLLLYDVGPKINDKSVKLLIKRQKWLKENGKLSTLKVRNLFSKAYLGIFSKPDNLIDKSTILATYSKYKVCPINLENFNLNDFKASKQIRYLKFLPKKNINKRIISKICNINLEHSKRNNLEKYINTYIKNF